MLAVAFPAIILSSSEPLCTFESDQIATLIHRHNRHGRQLDALTLFRAAVLDRRHIPNELSVTTALSCCSYLRALRSGRELHGFIVRDAGRTLLLGPSESSLVDLYSKCGLVSKAKQVFDRMSERDIVAWTTMLMAYADVERSERKMIELFVEMLSMCAVPNCHTFSVMLRRATIELGEQLHVHTMKLGLDTDAFVGNSLVSLYRGNEGYLSLAALAFGRIMFKDLACYNSLITCYGRLGLMQDAVSLFVKMSSAEFVPNQATLVGLLNGCSNFGNFNLSKQFHAQALLRGFGSDDVIRGVIVNMYAKCGDLQAACAALCKVSSNDNIAIWNSIICGYAKHGNAKKALEIFESMESAFVRPDHITFTCLLSACSHSGLVVEGSRLFCLMVDKYRIQAKDEHYCCMVDLLGRQGRVNEAYEFMRRSSHDFGPSVWGALLNACRICGNVEIGDIAARKLYEVEPECSASYLALASIYATKGHWGEATVIREIMNSRGIKKDIGYSLIEVCGRMHIFRAGKETGGSHWLDEVHLMNYKLHSSIRVQFWPEILACFDNLIGDG